MNTKSIPINPTTAKPSSFVKVALVSSLLTVGALALAYDNQAVEYKIPNAVPNIAPAVYGVTALKLDSDTSGSATIQLDSFTLKVGFDFESYPDSYGVADSSFTAIDITNLSVENITDINGKEYSDFTDYNDHRNINQLIATYIEKNNLVEAV